MAIYEYYCEACSHRFEQIVTPRDLEQGKCPKCNEKKHIRRLISSFKVGRRGDLREGTWDGCHGPPHSDEDSDK